MKKLKFELKRWNYDAFGDLEEAKRRSAMQIGTLDDIDEVRDISTQQALDRSKLLEELALVSNEQESLMY